jgi:hypothetical protein
LRELEGKGKGSGGVEEARERYQRQNLAPRRRRIYFASHLLEAAFDELPSWFLLIVCQENKSGTKDSQMVGLINIANKVSVD